MEFAITVYILSTDRTPPKAHSRQLFALNDKPTPFRCQAPPDVHQCMAY
jgi:hypothetical protein